jgi:hypothetical protein
VVIVTNLQYDELFIAEDHQRLYPTANRNDAGISNPLLPYALIDWRLSYLSDSFNAGFGMIRRQSVVHSIEGGALMLVGHAVCWASPQ